MPTIGSGDLLVRMHACGICGTDLEKVHGEHITPPILGHEVAGVVERVGEETSGYSVGDHVAVHHHISCGHCYYCKNGYETLCEEYPKCNLDPCGFAELFRVPERLVSGGTVHRLPESMSFEEASQAEPFACCLRALNRVGVKTGGTVAIFGVGPVGLSHLQLLRCFGATRVFAVDLIKKRREFALKLGAAAALDPTSDNVPKTIPLLNGGLGVDLAIVATANPKAVDSALDTIRKGGTILLFGVPARGSLLTMDMSKFFLREVRFQSSYSTSEAEIRAALELIRSRRVKPSETVTHRLPLSQTVDALALADKAVDALKVLVQN